MLRNKESVQNKINEFRRMSNCNFDINAFEAKAEQLNSAHPGEGYKLAYKEALENICEQLIEKSKTKEDVMDVYVAYGYFENVMSEYNQRCKDEGIDTNVQKTFRDATFKDDKEYYENMYKNVNANGAQLGAVYEQFKSGKLSSDEMVRFTRSKTGDDGFSVDDAVTVASYVTVLQGVNENRPFKWKVQHLFTHLKEKIQIYQMNKALKNNTSLDKTSLIQKATMENDFVKSQREFLKDALYDPKDEVQPMDIEKDAVDINKLPKKMQIEILEAEEEEAEKSPFYSENKQVSRTHVKQ